MESHDTIERYKGSIIQHGGYNDRIYVLKLAPEVSQNYPWDLVQVAKENHYSKICAKVPERHSDIFGDAGFHEEARIPEFYPDNEASLFMGCFLDRARIIEPALGTMKKNLSIARQKHGDDAVESLKDGFRLRQCQETDAAMLAHLYQKVFPSYPFPIHDPEYILSTMKSHVDYFGIETEGRLVAASSAEMDAQAAAVEMTDFATLPKWRGNGFAQILLSRMEEAMRRKGFHTAYTIARAMSAGMNITFSKAGYQMAGRLKNNTNISGEIESMNVWYKNLQR